MPHLQINLQNLFVGEELAPEGVVQRRSNREQAPFLQTSFTFPVLLIRPRGVSIHIVGLIYVYVVIEISLCYSVFQTIFRALEVNLVAKIS